MESFTKEDINQIIVTANTELEHIGKITELTSIDLLVIVEQLTRITREIN